MSITLRAATQDDIKLIFDWANDAETRKNSFNTSPIPWSTHEKWFTDRLLSRDTRIYVAQDEQGHNIGQIRFDREQDHAILGLSVDRAFRGRGFSIAILERGCELIFAEWKDIGFVLGNVKRGNQPVRRAVSKAHFLEEDAGGDVLVFRRLRG